MLQSELRSAENITHTRFQRFNMKKDNKNYLYLFYMKMIIIGGIELNRIY